MLLKEYLKNNKIRQTELIKVLNLAKSSVSNIVNNRKGLSLKTAKKIIDFTNGEVKLEDLL